MTILFERKILNQKFMKHFIRRPNNRHSVLVLILFALITYSCAGTKTGANSVPLTLEELEIKFLEGNQETTLELMYTHVPVATDHVASVIEARKKAVILDADVAQLILYYSGGSRRHGSTYRFWKLK